MRKFQTKILISIIISLVFFQIQTPLASPKALGTTYYVDATGGDDANDGTTPSSAWKTIAKVNNKHLISGDSILFKRGEGWREKLRINEEIYQSGSATHPITFGAYGTGEKPLLLGSVTQNSFDDWTDLGNNIWATADGSFPKDVGFILLGEEDPANVGTKCDYLLGIEDEVEEQHGYWYILNGVDEPKEYWHDFDHQRIILYCHQNPTLEYSTIEIAYSEPQFEDTSMISGFAISHITIENFQLKYFNNHGMHFLWSEGIRISNCDISYGGGQYLIWNQKVRYGNGVEFVDGTKDCSVEYCKFSEIYDTAVTNQGGWGVGVQENILYSNNLIWNCHYSYECFDRPESSVIRNVYFTNNTCLGAGFGWSFKQRYDPHGWHIPLWGNTAAIEGVYIIGNVFYESRNSSIFHSEYRGVSYSFLICTKS